MRFPMTLAVPAACVLFLASCEDSGAHVTAPKGGSAFARFVTIGTSLTVGAQSGGVVYSAQVQSWPALLARAAVADFRMPLFRSPGCSPPLVAPLELGRLLSGASLTVPDSSCAGSLSTDTLPLNNLALPGATAWAALNLTPKAITAAPTRYGAGDRARYPLTLGPTQSQVTAMIIKRPSFVAIELGLEEVLSAVTTGLVVGATSYAQAAPFTLVPAAVFAPVYAAVADSAKKSGARVVLLTVPHVTKLYALRSAAELWADRAELATFGVTVAADCNGGANMVFTPSVIPLLASRAASTLVAQLLSCSDVPGAADAVLAPADITALDASVDQMNAQIRQIAGQNGWAIADLDAEFSSFTTARASYRASDELACVYPYGAFFSFDGAHPNDAGHQAIANVVAGAVNAKYGFAIPLSLGPPVTRAILCP